MPILSMKTKTELIEHLATSRVVERLIEDSIKGEQPHNLQDLAQDIYLDLFNKGEDKLLSMYNKGELNYFLYRMIANNVYSVNSPYFKKYKLLQNKTDNNTRHDEAKTDTDT